MFTVIRLGNADFFEQRLDKAAKLMADAKSLFTSLNDRRGLGVAENNMGAILLSQVRPPPIPSSQSPSLFACLPVSTNTATAYPCLP